VATMLGVDKEVHMYVYMYVWRPRPTTLLGWTKTTAVSACVLQLESDHCTSTAILSRPAPFASDVGSPSSVVRIHGCCQFFIRSVQLQVYSGQNKYHCI
jgi:hypothetical protein